MGIWYLVFIIFELDNYDMSHPYSSVMLIAIFILRKELYV